MWRLSFLIALWSAFDAAAICGEPQTSDSGSLPQVSSVQIGFANRYKLGCWTPVAITLSGKNNDVAGRIDFQAADGDGVPAWFVGPEHSSNSSGIYHAYVRVGRANQSIRIGISNDDSHAPVSPQLLSSPASELSGNALPATNQFIVEFGASIGLPDTFRRQNQNDADRTAVVTIDSPQPLPDRWYGYDGVDIVVIVGAPALKKSLLNFSELDALQQWVQQGGELIICCGEDAEKVVGPTAPLARFAPGELVSVVNLPAARFGPIENFAAAEQRLEATSIRIPQWKQLASDHRIELSGGTRIDDLPLVIRWPVGFGQITFVGLDLDRAPFVQWPSRGKFLEKLLARHIAPTGRTAGARFGGQSNQLGYLDLAGQLRGALDQFDEVHLIPFWAVAALAVAFLVLLFPLSYWLVARRLRRQSLAWAVFAVVLVSFCTAAYALANYAKGDVRRVNEIDLTDFDLVSGSMRGAAWWNIFSPENALYDLRAHPRKLISSGASNNDTRAHSPSSALLAWLGLPGAGLGGMNSTAVNPPLFDEPYTIDPERGTMSGVPLSKWSSQSFVARWNSRIQSAPLGELSAQLTATADRRLRGTIENKTTTPLTDCVLLFDRWAYPLGTLAPGMSIVLDRAEAQTIDTYLTKRRTIAAHDEIPTYDRAGTDVLRIIEVMMFYQSAGGSNYTGLLNRYQRFTDLTDQLEFGRAILVARGPSGAELTIDGKPLPDSALDHHASIDRFIIPVQPFGGA